MIEYVSLELFRITIEPGEQYVIDVLCLCLNVSGGSLLQIAFYPSVRCGRRVVIDVLWARLIRRLINDWEAR